MKRALFLLASFVTFTLARRYRCLGKHELQRHWTGAQRCVRCGRGFLDLVEARLMDGSSHVSPLRRTFDRKHLAITQSGWVQ